MGREREIERGEGREERPQAKYIQDLWIQQCLTGLLYPGLLGGGGPEVIQHFFLFIDFSKQRN